MHARRALTAALVLASLGTPAVALAGPSNGDALVFRAPNGDLKVFDSATSRVLRTVAPGVIAPDGTTLLTARLGRTSTRLRRVSIASGAVVDERTIPGRWGFQQAAADGTLVAGGERGQPIALVAAGRTSSYGGRATRTRIAVLPSDLKGRLRVLHLAGDLGVDDVSPQGRDLYLIQHLGAERYRVRVYDLIAGRLKPGSIVDKREPGEQMRGLPLARATSADGQWVMTLYRRPSGLPFVHALLVDSLVAFCIDLPAAARVDPSAPSSWGLVVAGTTLFVANAASGFVAAVDYTDFKVARSDTLGAQTATGSLVAPLTASADGHRLFLARPQGLVSIAASSLEAGAPLADRAFRSLALGAGGSLYATGSATTERLDPRTGALIGPVAATRGLTLVGVVRRFQAR
ncbi:MAG TPA: hypothetical protein VGF46_06520 [Gaiellales bacterium]|jgi:hypothetical protein